MSDENNFASYTKNKNKSGQKIKPGLQIWNQNNEHSTITYSALNNQVENLDYCIDPV